MNIPYCKAHGAKNDFLLTWTGIEFEPSPEIAVAICDRHTGIGADGWILVTRGGDDCDGSIRLFNSDGSTAEISGNGTRCAAAFLIRAGAAGEDARIGTGAGVKRVRQLAREGLNFEFEMNMGRPEIREEKYHLALFGGPHDCTILWVGNPQCAVPVDNFDFDWRDIGAEIERHPHFPNRTNVSFVRRIDEHTIEARFFERGAGETMSSGTGSTGAAAMAITRGMAKSPVRVLTPAGPLDARWEGADMYLVGPAEIVADGEFYYQASKRSISADRVST